MKTRNEVDTIPVTIHIPLDTVRNCVSGSPLTDWCTPIYWDHLEIKLMILEKDTGDHVTIDAGKWGPALDLMARKLPHHFKDILNGTADKYTGQLLVQLAAFGEIRYE